MSIKILSTLQKQNLEQATPELEILCTNPIKFCKPVLAKRPIRQNLSILLMKCFAQNLKE